jgi:succinyl-CoA synthetase alpha subunit
MGPDCGTAILNGVPLGFANVVRRGAIGVVGASGTGMQQVTCLIDRLGAGVSQAIGTGGRDLHAEVGGMTMIQGLEALAADPATQVIVVISKPPAAAVAKRVLDLAARSGKPVVVIFLGLDPKEVRGKNLHPARTLEEGALLAVRLSEGEAARSGADPLYRPFDAAKEAAGHPLKLQPGQYAVRGLFSGGTFCHEALLLLGEALGDIRSNIPLEKRLALTDVWHSEGHTAIDLGDDRFTRGRPHPMIDHRLRNERIVQEAQDPKTAVILLDVVLGYGSHPDPAAEMAPTLAEARRIAAAAQREIAFVASVCGTAGDPQNLARQEGALEAAGVRIAASNARAAKLAAALAQRGRA